MTKKIKSGLTPAVGYKPRQLFNEEQEADKNKKKESESTKKVKRKGKGKGKQTKKPTKIVKIRVLQDDDSPDDEQEWYCIICCDAYSNSAPGEKWIECRECKNWAYLQCIEAEESLAFVCPNCYSDQSSRE